MESLSRDLWHGLRLLLKAPGLATLAILNLAVGIGANTAIFSVIHGILLSPLPYGNPPKLIRVWETDPARGQDRGPVSPANLADWRLRSHAFTSFAGSSGGYFNLAGEAGPRRVIGAPVTANLFSTLAVVPALGRAFTAEEDCAGRQRVVVLSHKLWQSYFHGDPQVVGKAVRIEGEPFTIVGVMPAGFYYPDPRFELWIPWVLDATEGSRSNHTVQVIARLRDGFDLDQAEREMTALARTLAREHPATNGGRGVRLLPLHEEVVGTVRPLLLLAMSAVGFVLLIACVNVAHLLLARAIERQKEMAIRGALGASRSRLLGQALMESLELALLSGAAGWLLARWGIELLVWLAPATLPRVQEVRLDAPVLGFTLAAVVVTGLLFGSIPAFQAIRRERFEILKEGGKETFAGGGASATALRRLLVITEISFAFVLLVAAGLMTRSFGRLTRVDLGFRSENRLAMDVSLPMGRYGEPPRAIAAYRQVLERVQALPGVESAALVSNLPLSGGWASRGFTLAGGPSKTSGETPEADFRLVSAGYFETLGIPLRRGRRLAPGAESGEVVINEQMARQFLPGRDPVGAKISFSGDEGPWLTIAGVVGDVRHYGPAGEPHPEIYQHYEGMPWPWLTMSLVIRAAGDPLPLVDSVRHRIWEIEPNAPVDNVTTLEHLVSMASAQARFNMLLLGLFAIVALILAVGGLYGVLSYAVGQRRHEISTRMALGAQQGDVLRMILGQSLGWAVAGIGLGTLLALALEHSLSTLVFGIGTLDPPTLGAVVFLLVGVSAAACYLPARRAACLEPMAALRSE